MSENLNEIEASLFRWANAMKPVDFNYVLKTNPPVQGKYPYNINAKNSFGWTLLHIACSNGNLALLFSLLQHPELNINPVDPEGRTPFHRACREGKLLVVTSLLADDRLDVNTATVQGYSPLWICVHRGHSNLLERIIISDHKLNLDIRAHGDDVFPNSTPVEVEERVGGMWGGRSTLLRQYQAAPELTRQQIFHQLGMVGTPQIEKVSRLSRYFLQNLQPPSIQDPSEVTEITVTSHPRPVDSNVGRLVSLQKLSLVDSPIEGSLFPADDASVPPSRLTHLTLKNSSMSNPESAFAALRNLTNLSIFDCKLDRFPEVICTLTNLQVLWIRKERISEISPSIGRLKQLTELNLSGNQLVALPDSLGQLDNLQSLNLSDGKFRQIPGSLRNLAKLRSLNLSCNHNLDPDSVFSSAVQVTTLTMESCDISQLPDSISNLKDLEMLFLRGNCFSSLPDTFDSLLHLQYIEINSKSPMDDRSLRLVEKIAMRPTTRQLFLLGCYADAAAQRGLIELLLHRVRNREFGLEDVLVNSFPLSYRLEDKTYLPLYILDLGTDKVVEHLVAWLRYLHFKSWLDQNPLKHSYEFFGTANSISEVIYGACAAGDRPVFLSLLAAIESPNVSFQGVTGLILHLAAFRGDAPMVEAILANTHLRLTKSDTKRQDALHNAVWSRNMEIVRLLVRANFRLVDPWGSHSSLIDACELGVFSVIHFALETYSAMDVLRCALQPFLGYSGNKSPVTLEWVLLMGDANKMTEAASKILRDAVFQPDHYPALLRDFIANPSQVRRDLSKRLLVHRAADLFAMTVLYSDGYFRAAEQGEGETLPNPARFLAMTSQLPIELQMRLAFLAFGANKNFIRGVEFEEALKRITLLLEQ